MGAPAITGYDKGATASKGGIMFGDGLWLISGAGNPVNGTTGDGWAGTGSLYINVTAGTLFQNTGPASATVWATRT